MRSFCFWLMIALMPLRAWAGDAMAVQMALSGALPSTVAQAVATEECPSHGVFARVTGHEGHGAGHDVPRTQETPQPALQVSQASHDSHSDDGVHNCLHCDICQGKVHAVLLSLVASSGAERELPAYGDNPIHLGPAASFFKPPIV